MTARLASPSGFALPTVILLVALLTVLLAGGLSRVRADRQVAHASEETGNAFAIAQTGMQAYMGSVAGRPADGDSARINVVGGYANVVAHVLKTPVDTMANQLFLIRSTGVAINPNIGSTPQGRRTVAQFAEWQTGYIERRATLTMANGVRLRNGSSTIVIWGTDACGQEPPIPAIRTTVMTGPPNPPMDTVGAPPLVQHGAGTGLLVAAQTDVDWAAAIGGGIVPDDRVFRQGDTSFPIQLITGSLSLGGTSTGSGLLIVTGDLLLSGTSFYFEGVILVGGKIDFGASSNEVHGMLMSGLNEQLGINPQRTEISGGGKDLSLYFDACRVNQALAPLTGLTPVQNAWLDSWSVY
ncbi:MAG: hypothetical protein OER21_13225 [Gemmatimonadota bacterium]|nr:hypothetical protein [Gemmatimonadota bacterium]